MDKEPKSLPERTIAFLERVMRLYEDWSTTHGEAKALRDEWLTKEEK